MFKTLLAPLMMNTFYDPGFFMYNFIQFGISNFRGVFLIRLTPIPYQIIKFTMCNSIFLRQLPSNIGFTTTAGSNDTNFYKAFLLYNLQPVLAKLEEMHYEYMCSIIFIIVSSTFFFVVFIL